MGIPVLPRIALQLEHPDILGKKKKPAVKLHSQADVLAFHANPRLQLQPLLFVDVRALGILRQFKQVSPFVKYPFTQSHLHKFSNVSQ
jgi:hypothetical protein